MNRLRLAVVGVGHLGRVHARLAAGLDRFELVAVVDERPEARETVARDAGCRAVAQVRDLIGEIDAAVVATPNPTPLPGARELIHGGVHVLVEKPLAPTAVEADQLVTLARKRHVVLQVGHVERFNPALVSVQPELRSPKFIEARRLTGYTFRSIDVGVVLDLMIHDIDVALALVDSPVTAVDAAGISVMGGHEDMVSARLRFACGAVACLTASRTSYTPARTMQVFTPTRFASIDFGARRATLVTPREDVLRRTLRTESLGEEQRQQMRERLFEDVLVRHEPAAVEANAIEEELVDFAEAIRTGRAPRVTGADGRDAVEVAERIVQCVAEHRWDADDPRLVGPLATPLGPPPAAAADFSADDTVIWRRKAG